MTLIGQATGMLKELFEYNRENFMEDRNQRQIMEYDLMSFRIEQVKLWREDIREVADLTPEKNEIYLLVIALELGFCVMALCKGRVPPGAPPWLVACHTIAICTALMYLTLAFWFSMHAFVSAQAYKVRILTQLVRTPIPTWRSMEASRTYSSAFEGLGRSQMVRVPFVGGEHEATRGKRSQEEAAETSTSPRRSAPPLQSEESVASDPWGLERRASIIPELAPDVNVQNERQRHIWLIREASKFYQTYDAFCRVSMSAGTCSLATFFCYFCLSYVLTENAAPVAAWCGMIGFGAAGVVIIGNDMMLKKGDFFVLVALRFIPLMLSACVTFMSSKNAGDPGDWQYLMPIALLGHGLAEIYYLVLFRVREVQTGALLPMAFRGLLFLDPFAWAKHAGTWHKRLRQNLMQQGRTFWATSNPGLALMRSDSRRDSTPRNYGRSQAEIGLFSRSRLMARSSGFFAGDDGVRLPAMECTESSDPVRPEDVAFEDDEDAEDGLKHSVSFRPSTFSTKDVEPQERVQISTGTDIHGEYPGLVPWKLFFTSTMVVTLVWFYASGVALVNARKGAAIFVSPHYGLEDGHVAVVEDLRVSMSAQMHFGMRYATTWENASLMAAPSGFTCDTSGQVFAAIGPASDGKRGVLHGYLDSTTVRFRPSPECRAIGEPVEDVTFTDCPQPANGGGTCFVDVLSRSGNLSRCSITAAGPGARPQARPLSHSWLQDRGGVAPARYTAGDSENLLFGEGISALTAVPCPGDNRSRSLDCYAMGTTARRLVQLGQLKHAGPFVPRRLLHLDSHEIPDAGSLALLQGRYLGMLLPDAGLLRMFDLDAGGKVAGTWRLPHLRSAHPRAASGRGQWAGLCGGGSYFYLLEAGDEPGIWRFPVPEMERGNVEAIEEVNEAMAPEHSP